MFAPTQRARSGARWSSIGVEPGSIWAKSLMRLHMSLMQLGSESVSLPLLRVVFSGVHFTHEFVTLKGDFSKRAAQVLLRCNLQDPALLAQHRRRDSLQGARDGGLQPRRLQPCRIKGVCLRRQFPSGKKRCSVICVGKYFSVRDHLRSCEDTCGPNVGKLKRTKWMRCYWEIYIYIDQTYDRKERRR